LRRSVILRHRLQSPILQGLDISAAVVRDRQDSLRQLQPRGFDGLCIATKVASNLLPGFVERFTHGLQRFWPERGAVDQPSRFYFRSPRES
jgi:hypothetical protein